MIGRILFGLLIVFAGVIMSSGASAEMKLEKATFAGGCFWCMEPHFEKLDGVKEVISGYTGGHKVIPTHKEVSACIAGHAEAVEVIYDPTKVTYEKLLDILETDRHR